MAAEIVHDDDVTWLKRRQKKSFNIEAEAQAVYGAVHDARRVDTVAAQGRQEGHGFPMPERCLGA